MAKGVTLASCADKNPGSIDRVLFEFRHAAVL